MRQYHPEIEIECFFTDTGKELPEANEFPGRLEGVLEKQVERLDPDRDFDFWLKQYNSFPPSPSAPFTALVSVEDSERAEIIIIAESMVAANKRLPMASVASPED